MSPTAAEREWLRRYAVHPRKSWGQHFLINPRVVARLVQSWRLRRTVRVLEIGAGSGALTLPLLARGHRVVAVERDPGLCTLLRERAQAECPESRLTVVNGNILEVDPRAEPLRLTRRSSWVLVGNLPYLITTGILGWTLRHRRLFRWASFMVQREYGERLVARPGTAAYGSLTVWVGFHFRVAKEFRVGPGNFWPVPKVDSLILRLTPRDQPPFAVPSAAALERAVRAAFSQRRKMITGSLAAGLDLPRATVEAALEEAGIDPRKRAEQCDLEEFAALARALAVVEKGPGSGVP